MLLMVAAGAARTHANWDVELEQLRAETREDHACGPFCVVAVPSDSKIAARKGTGLGGRAISDLTE